MQVLLLFFTVTSNAARVPARFLREPGEKFGVKYELPKQFNAKELLDSKSSMLSSELTTFDDSPDTEEKLLDEAYTYEKVIAKHVDTNAAEENFDDYPGPSITLPDRRDVDYDYNPNYIGNKNIDLFTRKKRSWYKIKRKFKNDHLNMENDEQMPPVDTQEPTMNTDLPETESTNLPESETTNLPESESSPVEQGEETTTSMELTDNTQAPMDATNPDISTQETMIDNGITSQDNGPTDWTSTTVQDGTTEEPSTDEGAQESISFYDETLPTIPNTYTAPPFDLLDFLMRLEKIHEPVIEGYGMFNLPMPHDY